MVTWVNGKQENEVMHSGEGYKDSWWRRGRGKDWFSPSRSVRRPRGCVRGQGGDLDSRTCEVSCARIRASETHEMSRTPLMPRTLAMLRLSVSENLRCATHYPLELVVI